MRQLFLCLAVSLTVAVAHGQTSNWLWAKTADGDISNGSCVSTDRSGNVLVTGYFNSATINFGTVSLANSGSFDLFLVKYDSLGNILWAKTAGGGGDDYSYGISTDTLGNIYITGHSNSPSIVFGSYTLSAGLFLVKYDASGNILWAKGTAAGNATGASVSTSGKNIYVTGFYDSPTVVFGSDILTNAGQHANIFLAKYDSSGNVQWAKGAGGINIWGDGAYGVSADHNGNAYITGKFNSDSIAFGLDTLFKTNPYASSVFLTKYDSSGNVLWAKSAGGNGNDCYSNSICTDKNGNVFITGRYASANITFDTITITHYINGNAIDMFLAKYNSTGNVLWAKGGDLGSQGNSVSTDNTGNVFVAGNFAGKVVFAPDTLTNLSGYVSLFLVKYDSNGNVFWAETNGKNGQHLINDYGNSVSTDSRGNAYITGEYGSSIITFDTIALVNAKYNSLSCGPNGSNCEDFYIAKSCNTNAFITGNAILCVGQSTTLTVTTPGTNYLWNTSNTTASIIVSPTATTTYSVIASIGNFTATATTTVVVNQNPPPSAGINSTINGSVITFSDGSTAWAGDSLVGWNWQFPGGNPSASNLENPGIVYYFPGTFVVCLTVVSSKGCANTSCDTNLVLSTDWIQNLPSIAVYPNPISAQAILQTNIPLHNATLAVYNFLGQTVKRIDNLYGQTIIFDRDNLPSGLYFLRLTQDGKTFLTHKFVITDR